MKNIVGCTVFFLKNIENQIITEIDSEITGQKTIAVQKIIPLDLKDSYQEFVKSIGDEIPSEDQFNEWHSNQK